MFPSPWAEPIVLLALGLAFLFVSRRTVRTRSVVAKLPARAAAPASAAAPARVAQAIPVEAIPVEQSA
ncbi:MAG TPA: hypothetical protein VFK90_07985 [Anaeromyxobacter sp.]|nr:hypothetical protein [Anaeromyxobacter sp.]